MRWQYFDVWQGMAWQARTNLLCQPNNGSQNLSEIELFKHSLASASDVYCLVCCVQASASDVYCLVCCVQASASDVFLL